MKIAFFDLKLEDKALLTESFPDDELYLYEEVLKDDHLSEIKDVDVISFRDRSKLSKAQADKLPNLKLIANRITGFDNVQKEIYATGDILLCNVPAYGATTVAEYAFAHILNLSRKIYRSILTRDPQMFAEDQITGFDLEGKTIGIIGTGRIGFNVARIARGFNMEVVGYDIYQNEEMAAKYDLKYLSLDELLATADVISLNLPLTDQTKYIINQHNVLKIKKGAILVNTGRGGLLDVKAIIAALDAGILAGAGLDVLEGEDIIFKGHNREKVEIDEHNLKLLDYKNVVITPHNAFNTKNAHQRIITTTLENIHSYMDGKPINLVKI